MKFDIEKSTAILKRTPEVLHVLLSELPPDWVYSNEGEGTWSVFDIIGHLVHGEKTDWVPRMELILSGEQDKKFPVFDRFAQFEESAGKTLEDLLQEFSRLRKINLEILHSKHLTEQDLNEHGIHPAFGEVKLSQLLATWTAHDLNHLAQISRVMAKQYREEVGPWVAYLGILK